MLSTNTQNLFVEVSDRTDGTVSVFPGAARIGNTLFPYQGGNLAFNRMVTLTDASTWQNSILLLYPVPDSIGNVGSADLTCVVSDATTSARALQMPVISDATVVQPLGIFTFRTNDGVSIQLDSYFTI